MESSVHDEYFTMEVLTAPPQKLQLMLLEAAIRAVQKAQATWNEDDRGLACEALVQAQECVAQILAGLNLQAGKLAHQLAGLYGFVLRRLRDANLQRNGQALDEALKILKMEHQTWQMLCQKLNGPGPVASANEAGSANLPETSWSFSVQA